MNIDSAYCLKQLNKHYPLHAEEWWIYQVWQILPMWQFPLRGYTCVTCSSGSEILNRTLATLFKALKTNSKATQALLWWCFFKPQTKPINHILVEDIVIEDASKRDMRDTWKTILQRQMTRKEWQGDTHQYPVALDSVNGLSEVWGWDEREIYLLLDRQHNNSGLSSERGQHLLQHTEWSCLENHPTIPQEWSRGLPGIPLRTSKPHRRCFVQRQEGLEMECREPYIL